MPYRLLGELAHGAGRTGCGPRLKPQAPQVPILREFSNQMLSFVKVQKKAGHSPVLRNLHESLAALSRFGRCPALGITGGGEQFTMKRSRNSNEHALAVQKPAPEKAEPLVVGAKKKTRKQLIDEVVKTACKVTGTQNLDAADRFIVQVGYALVWPQPKE